MQRLKRYGSPGPATCQEWRGPGCCYLPRRGVCANALAAAVLAALDAVGLDSVRLAALAARALVCLLFLLTSITSFRGPGVAFQARKVISCWLRRHWV